MLNISPVKAPAWVRYLPFGFDEKLVVDRLRAHDAPCRAVVLHFQDEYFATGGGYAVKLFFGFAHGVLIFGSCRLASLS